MKLINISKLFILLGFAIWSLNSCSADEETIIIPKTVEEYQQQMKQFVDSQIVIVKQCVIGYNKGDFKSATNFDAYKADYLAALRTDSAIIVKPDVTIAELVAGNKLLAIPGKNFNGSLWISDRRPLNDSIIAAEALNAATLTGTTTGSVPEEAKTTFTAAIAKAKTVRSASTTIERQVNEANVTLTAAKKVFVLAIIK
ncbi:MAG: hypothetical protein QM800_13005 [Paludibacter sp.]